MKSVRDLRGGDQSGMRAYNRRMILNLIRQSGALPKAEIARATGLSAQAVSVIVNELLRDGLVRKEERVRGRVGQPHTPISIDPDGALSVGVKIGRRSLELALINFVGGVLRHISIGYEAPRRRQVVDLVEAQLTELLASVERAQRTRIVGLGVAMPGQIGEWTEEIGLAPSELDDWAEFDVTAKVSEISGLPAELYNDATAACAAEMQIGEALTQSSALYIYIGSFIGSGVVLDGRLYYGSRGNAGAIGSMPILSPTRAGQRHQLIRGASLVFLDRALRDSGITEYSRIADAIRDKRAAKILAEWRSTAARAIAQAVACAMSVIDFEAVIIDAMLPHEEVETMTDAVRTALGEIDWTGLSPVQIRPGSVGAPARVLGAAILPLIRQYSPDQELLVKRTAEAA